LFVLLLQGKYLDVISVCGKTTQTMTHHYYFAERTSTPTYSAVEIKFELREHWN